VRIISQFIVYFINMHFVQKLQNTVEKQKCIIENKNNCDDTIQHLKLDIITIKNVLNTLITNINDLRTKIMFIGSNIIIIDIIKEYTFQ